MLASARRARAKAVRAAFSPGPLERRLAELPVPFYATIGNHELGIFGSAAEGWHDLFGRHSSHFHFRSIAFALVDTAGGSVIR
jgi:hypothetical protein